MLAWHKALLKLRREHPSLQGDARKGVSARLLGTTLLMQRGDVLLVASFAEGPWSVQLPSGEWRLRLDSAASRRDGSQLSGHGRHAVILERA